MKREMAFAAAALTAIMAPLGACANQSDNQSTTSPSSSAAGAEKMTTQLKSADGTTVANATIDFTSGYATVTVEAGPNNVLTQGFHGLQIHAVGKCESDFSSAGSVYQAPGHTGFPASGDLTALQVRSDGSAKLVTTTNSFTAADLRNSSGTALVIHQAADNLGGASTGEGKRLACGVITAAAATTTSSTTETTTVTTVTTAVPPPSTSTSTSTVTVTSTPTVTTTPTYTVTTTPPSTPPR